MAERANRGKSSVGVCEGCGSLAVERWPFTYEVPTIRGVRVTLTEKVCEKCLEKRGNAIDNTGTAGVS